MAAKKRDKSLKSKAVAKQDQDQKSSFQFSRISEFVSEVKVEFRKIVWPDKKVTIGSTGVVIVLVCILSIYLGAVDLFVGKLISQLLEKGKGSWQYVTVLVALIFFAIWLLNSRDDRR